MSGDLVERALAVATKAHEGQKRTNGDPYITHPVRVAGACPDRTHKAVAMLHDVIEDTSVTEEELRQQFSGEIVDAVVALTRPPHVEGQDRETYTKFVRRTKLNPIACVVKIADVNDNLRDLPADDGRRRRYTRALKILEGSGEIVLPEIGVAVMLEGYSGQFLVSRRLKSDKVRHYTGYWQFPGGHVNRGETIKQAAMRELKEEVGVEAPIGNDSAVWIDDRQLVEENWMCIFFAADIHPIPNPLPPNPEPEKHTDWEWMHIDKIIRLKKRMPGMYDALDEWCGGFK